MRFCFPGNEAAERGFGVPPGWSNERLGEVLIEIESGSRPKGGAESSGIPSIGAENILEIGRYNYAKEKYVSEKYFDSMRRGVVRDRDVVLYKDGANIGRSSFFGDSFPHAQCAVNEHVFILRARPSVGQNILYFWMDREETRKRIQNLNTNTAQPGVSRAKLETLLFPCPPVSVARAFDKFVDPVVQQIFRLARAQRTLEKTRDMMLPRLMSGEIAV